MRREFDGRHLDIEELLLGAFEKVRAAALHQTAALPTRASFSSARSSSGEYALESAALFNPSIVPHPDQTGIPTGRLRFIMSLRATGEGHISSIEFRSGVIDAGGAHRARPSLALRHRAGARAEPELQEDRRSSSRLHEMGFDNATTEEVMARRSARSSRLNGARREHAHASQRRA